MEPLKNHFRDALRPDPLVSCLENLDPNRGVCQRAIRNLTSMMKSRDRLDSKRAFSYEMPRGAEYVCPIFEGYVLERDRFVVKLTLGYEINLSLYHWQLS